MLVSDNGPRTSSLIPLYLLYADALCVMEKYKKCLIRVSDRLRLLDLALAGDVRLDALRPLHLGDALAALAPVRLVPAMANRMQLELLGQSKHMGSGLQVKLTMFELGM